jgi:hypothetical protein
MSWFVGIYLVLGFLLAIGLYGWATVSSIRRHLFRSTVRGAATTYLRELPLYWRVPWAAWTVLIAAPLIGAWALITGSGTGSARSSWPCSGSSTSDCSDGTCGPRRTTRVDLPEIAGSGDIPNTGPGGGSGPTSN